MFCLVFRKKDLYLVITQKLIFMKFSGFHVKNMTYVTGCGQSVSTRASRDLGELHSSTERDSSFPHSTPGAVPLIPTHI